MIDDLATLIYEESLLTNLPVNNNTYSGRHNEDDYEDVLCNGKVLDPEPSLKIRNHSPTGFAWGYGGSGPSQLALAILLNEFGHKVAERFYMDFKWKFIATLPNETNSQWELTSEQIRNWLIGANK
jgi:hypothetical protein